ncbi:MAG: c-type cytochrome [Desulfuromonadaceae bacterium]
MSKKNPFYILNPLTMCLVIAACFFLGGCNTDQSKELTPQQQMLRTGKDLFSQRCAACHGARGSGMGARSGPGLQGDNYRYGNDRDVVFNSIHDGREDGMPAFSSVFTREQIEALTEYVLYLQK